MTPEVALHQKLNQATRRIRSLLVIRWTGRLLCGSAGFCLLWLLISKLNWVEEPTAEVVAVILGLAALTGIGFGLFVRLSVRDVARLTDKRTAMKERLASAVEFESLAQSDPLIRRQIHDAGARAGELDLRRVYPLKLTREMIGFVVLALVLFGSFFLPRLPIFWSAEKRKEMEEVKKQGIQIEKIAKDAQKNAEQKKLDESKKAAQEAQKLAQAMKKGQVDKKQSLIQMQKLTRKMEEQQKKLAMANTPAPKPMEQAAKEAQKALEQQQRAVDDAQRDKKNQVAKADAKKGDKPDSKENADKKDGKRSDPKTGDQKQMSQAMQKAQEALQKFADALTQQNPEMQNQAMQELADQMEKGGMSQEEMKQLQKQLDKMANALSKSDLDKVAKQLAELAKLMEQMKKMDPEMLKKLAQGMRAAGGT